MTASGLWQRGQEASFLANSLRSQAMPATAAAAMNFQATARKPASTENRPFFAATAATPDDQRGQAVLGNLVATAPVGICLAGVECVTCQNMVEAAFGS